MPQRKPEHGIIDWRSMSVTQVYNWVRAQSYPYPGAFTYIGQERVTIWRASSAERHEHTVRPGTVVPNIAHHPNSFGVWCADGGMLLVHEVGICDGQPMSGAAFLRSKVTDDQPVIEMSGEVRAEF